MVMRPQGGPLASLVMAWLVRGDAQRICEHRARVMAERFGGDVANAEVGWVDDLPAAPPRAAERPRVRI